MSSSVESLVNKEYKYGFVTDIEADVAPKGLNEDIIRLISAKKQEPEWLLEWRLKAFRGWLKMTEPHAWANITYTPVDYQAISYYSAPRTKKPLGSLDEVDPKLLETYTKLGIPLSEQKLLAGVVAVDAIFDSVSVGTTYKAKLAEQGIIFCSFGEAVREHPELVRKYLGSVVPASDNFFAALNAAVFSDGSFVYIPKGVKCPMELSTYFRINTAETGQFERTLIVADEGASVSYLEGCTAPKRDENQLHAAVVELVALDNATIKYSTVQNWYAGDDEGKGGIYNFVTKRGKAPAQRQDLLDPGRDRLGDHLEVPERHPAGRQLGGRVLFGGGGERTQQADTGTKMIHIGKNTRSTIVSKGISAGRGQNSYRGLVKVLPKAEGARNYTQCDSMLIGNRCGAHTFPYIDVQNSLLVHRARGLHVEDRRGPDLLPEAARPQHRERHLDDRERLLQGSVQGAADGVRGRGAEAAGYQPGRQRRIAPEATCRPVRGAIHVNGQGATIAGNQRPPRQRGRQGDPQGHRPHGQRRRGPRGHGPQRLGQEHAGPGAGRPPGLRGDRRLGHVPRARTCSSWSRRSGRRPGVFLAFQYPVEIPGRHQRLFPARGVQRDPEGARPGGGRLDGLPRPARGEAQAGRVGARDHEPGRQFRLLGRREEAERDPADGGAGAHSSPSSTRPTPGSTSTRSGSWPPASTSSGAPTTPPSS